MWISVRFYPSGSLAIAVLEGRRLCETDKSGSSPYVKLTLQGACKTHALRTKTDFKGGSTPMFNEMFVVDIVDHTELLVRQGLVRARQGGGRGGRDGMPSTPPRYLTNKYTLPRGASRSPNSGRSH